jgi:hypothetical protein
MSNRTISAFALAAASLLLSTGAQAQARTWNFGDVTSPGSCPTGGSGPIASTIGNVLTCSTVAPSSSTTSLEVRAFSSTATNSTGSTVTSSGTAGTHFETAAVNYHGTGSGIGVANQWEGASVTGSPNHAMDNSTPGVDALLLNFVGIGAQVLKTVTLGWTGADGDFQVLRWTGSGSAPTSIDGISQASLLSSSWELVSTVNGAGGIDATDVSYGVNTGNLSSSAWIITAFNSTFGGAGSASAGIDAIKVLAVTTGVSAPGTLALAGLGLLGAALLRRRNA